jgi:hypothetical protein
LKIATARSLYKISHIPASCQHDEFSSIASKLDIALTSIIDPDIDLPSESLLHVPNDLVDLGTGIDVTLERLDANAVVGRELRGDRGSIGRGECYG